MKSQRQRTSGPQKRSKCRVLSQIYFVTGTKPQKGIPCFAKVANLKNWNKWLDLVVIGEAGGPHPGIVCQSVPGNPDQGDVVDKGLGVPPFVSDSPLNSSLECSGQFGLGGQVVLCEPDMSWSVGLQMKRNNSKEGLELKYYKKALFFYLKRIHCHKLSNL